MRTAIISDIHANLEALQTVLDRIETLKPDGIICLGDMVGYNASPNECLDLLQEKQVRCILGNHDAVAAGIEEPGTFTPLASAAVLWTREQLTDRSRAFLRALPREVRARSVALFHGSLHDTNRYLLSREDAQDNFKQLWQLDPEILIGFFGHTHVRAAFIEDYGIIARSVETEQLFIEPWKRYLVNPGSVGQPRDGDHDAAFLVYDDQEQRVFFHRAVYDIARCQERIKRAGLPHQLAERLAWGR